MPEPAEVAEPAAPTVHAVAAEPEPAPVSEPAEVAEPAAATVPAVDPEHEPAPVSETAEEHGQEGETEDTRITSEVVDLTAEYGRQEYDKLNLVRNLLEEMTNKMEIAKHLLNEVSSETQKATKTVNELFFKISDQPTEDKKTLNF